MKPGPRPFEVDLEDHHIHELLDVSKENPRDYLILGYLMHGLRVGEVIGEARLPGLQAEDFYWDDGIAKVQGKGFERGSAKLVLQPVHPYILKLTMQYLDGGHGRIFRFSGRTYRWAFKKYCRLIKLPGWEEAHPHRVRHWFENTISPYCRDGFEVMGMMRHSKETLRKLFGSTTVYVRDPSLPRRRELTFLALQKIFGPAPEPIAPQAPEILGE